MRGAWYKPLGSWALEDCKDCEDAGWVAQDLCGRGRGAAMPVRGAQAAVVAPVGVFENARSHTNSPLEAALGRLAIAKLAHPRLGPPGEMWTPDIEEQVGRMVVSTLTGPWPALEDEDGEAPDYNAECLLSAPGSGADCECSQCLLRQLPVVIDVGSHTTTVGFGGEEGLASFPSVVARRLLESQPEPAPEHQPESESPTASRSTASATVSEKCTPGWETVAVGDAALAVENDGAVKLVDVGHLRPPVEWAESAAGESERGQVAQFARVPPSVSVDWDAMEAVWRHSFTGVLGLKSAEHPLLLTEPPLNAQSQRERLLSLAFECLGSPAVFLASSAVLALYASGRSTGAIIEIGASGTCISLSYEGHLLPHCTKRNSVGTTALGMSMLPALERAGCVFMHKRHQTDCCDDLWAELAIIRALPPATNRIMQDDSTTVEDVAFRVWRGLAGGHVDVRVAAAERLACGEALLDPSAIAMPDRGLLHLLDESVRTIGPDDGQLMWANLVLTGGGCVLRNLEARLNAELKRIDPHTHTPVISLWSRGKCKISSCQHYGTAIGGLILSGLHTVRKHHNHWYTHVDEVQPCINMSCRPIEM